MPNTCTTYFLNKCVDFCGPGVPALHLDNRGQKKCMRYKRRSDKEEMAECVSWVHRGLRE